MRWHSPPDWTETDQSDEAKESSDGSDSSSMKGQLSRRMQKEGIPFVSLSQFPLLSKCCYSSCLLKENVK